MNEVGNITVSRKKVMLLRDYYPGFHPTGRTESRKAVFEHHRRG